MNPIDDAILFLKNKVLPYEPFEEVGKLTALRLLPREHLSTVEQPQVIGGTDYGGTGHFEEQASDMGLETVPGWAEGENIHGTWVYPPDLKNIGNPDVNYNLNREMALVGTLDKKPEWHGKRLNEEGFKYGGYDKDDFREVPTHSSTQLANISLAARALQHGASPSEMDPRVAAIMNSLQEAHIPHSVANPLKETWGKPVTRAPLHGIYKPGAFTGRKVASEPMEIAMRLLKAGPSGTSRSDFSRFHLPTELNTENLTQYLQEQGGTANLGDLIQPYLMGQFTDNSNNTPLSYQEQQIDQNQELQDAPFPLTQNNAEAFANQFQTNEGYGLPWKRPQGENKVQQDLLSNILRVLHGRIRQQGDIYDMKPPRTYRKFPTKDDRNLDMNAQTKRLHTGTKGRTLERMNRYMNTPISVRTGEPMEITMRLLKMPLLPESVRDAGVDKYGINEYTADFEHPETGKIYPMQGYVDRDEAGTFIYPPNIKPPKESPPIAGDGHSLAGAIGEAVFMPHIDYPNPQEKEWTGSPYIRERDPFAEGNEFGEESLPVGMGTAMYDLAAIMADKRHGAKIVPSPARSHQAQQMWAKHEDKGYWPVKTGEPMEIAMRLLKDRVSPEAKRHKLEYDTKYESSPERVKYREDLNRERRKRGMYGDHSHRDISHTEGGKLTVEGEHSNRARHFKERGTLRKRHIKVLKPNTPKPSNQEPIPVESKGDHQSYTHD